MIMLQDFVFDAIYHLILRDSAFMHPRVHFFKVYFFVSCFPIMPSNTFKLKYRNMKLNALEIIRIWCNISPRAKGFSFSVH